MKKIILIIIAIAVCFSPSMGGFAFAAEDGENLDATVNDALDNIDLSGYDELIALLNEYNDYSFGKSARQIIDDILYGKAEPTFGYFIKAAGSVLGIELSDMLPQLVIITVIAFLYGILKNLNSGFLSSGTQKIVFLACYALSITVLSYMFVDSIKYSIRTFDFLKKFNDACFPVLITLMSAFGATTSAAVYQPFVLIFSNTLMTLVNSVIMPLFYVTFVFGLVGNLSENLKLDKFSSVAKSIAEWTLGIVFGTFVTLLTAQGITGSSIDNLATKGAKYALSGYVPVIGGYLKDGFDIVTASCVVIKNAVGLCALIILLAGILIPIIKMTALSFGLKITAAVAEPLSDNKFSSVLNTAGESLKVLIVAVICSGVSLLITIMLIIYTCNPGNL